MQYVGTHVKLTWNQGHVADEKIPLGVLTWMLSDRHIQACHLITLKISWRDEKFFATIKTVDQYLVKVFANV